MLAPGAGLGYALGRCAVPSGATRGTRVNGVVISIVLTAILAGIAAIPAHFVAQAMQRAKKSARPPSWPFAVALAVAIGGAALLKPYLSDLLARQSDPMAELEQALPIYKTIREHEPALYENLRQEMVRAEADGLSRTDAANVVRARLAEYVTTNMALVPDDVLLRLMTVAVKQGSSLAASNPELCVTLLMGRPVGDIAPLIPDELEAEELAAMEALILAPKEAGRPALDEVTGTQLSVDIIHRKSAEAGIPLEDFGQVDGGLEPARACAALTAFLNGIVELPQDRAAAMLRWSSTIE